MKSVKLIFFFLCLAAAASGQRHTINGYITDKKSGERLLGASVTVSNLGLGTTSNNFGFFSITLPAGKVVLRISYSGYSMYSDSLELSSDTRLSVELNPEKKLEEVVVKSSRKGDIQNRTQMSAIDLPIQTIKSLPAFLGEVDIMKAIQLLPGIQAGNEGSSGIYVRGGGPDQNLILLDGVPVYNVSHLFGFFSVFNADAINSVEVIKGGFPARYGGRLSSVIDIRMKEGNKNELHGEGGIGLIASRLTLEGPLKKGRSSFMISGRRTYADLFLRPLVKRASNGEVSAGYFFYDLNGKANFKLSEKDHLYISGYFGNDKFGVVNQNQSNFGENRFSAGLKWGNATAVARWNHEFNKRLFGNLTFHYSRYNFQVSADDKSATPTGNEQFFLKYFSGIRDWSAKYEFDYLPSPNHFIKAGFGGTLHSYKPGAVQSRVKTLDFNEDTLLKYRFIDATELDAFIEDDIRLSSKLKMNLGVHWTGFSVNNQFFHSVQPRVSMRYLITPDISAKASFAQMNQFIHLLTNSNVGLPTDLWVPVTGKVPPQRSYQAAAGLAWNYNRSIEISVEGYYKRMDNVIEYAEGASYINATSNWEDKVEIGRGWSYGGELFVQKKKGRTTGMMGYTLSYTNRRFENLNRGKTFPFKFDRRHDFKVAVVHTISKRVELSGEWIFGTGQAISLPVEVYRDNTGNEIEVYNGRNGFRMRPYHRLDLGVRFSKQKAKYERAWVIGIYNIYNRQNPFFYFRDEDFATNLPVFKQVALFPIIPSISYQFKF